MNRPFALVKLPYLLCFTAAIAALSIGCVDDYQPIVICHNANCVEPTAPEEDSTMETLVASLELFDEERGRPFVDGMEIDTFWWGEEGQCLFAHDLDHPERAVAADHAVDHINAVLSERAEADIPLTRSADRYTILIELKGHVAPSKEAAHTAEQLADHAACGIDMAQSLIASADDHQYQVEVVFMSFAPALLQGLFDDPRYSDLQAQEHPVALTILQGIPRPLDIQTIPLDEFPDDIGIDRVSVHPHWTRDPAYEVFRSRELELGYWMFNIVPETLKAIKVHRPHSITTSQAPTLAGWLDRNFP